MIGFAAIQLVSNNTEKAVAVPCERLRLQLLLLQVHEELEDPLGVLICRGLRPNVGVREHLVDLLVLLLFNGLGSSGGILRSCR